MVLEVDHLEAVKEEDQVEAAMVADKEEVLPGVVVDQEVADKEVVVVEEEDKVVDLVVVLAEVLEEVKEVAEEDMVAVGFFKMKAYNKFEAYYTVQTMSMSLY